jgi:hypothetical protein
MNGLHFAPVGSANFVGGHGLPCPEPLRALGLRARQSAIEFIGLTGLAAVHLCGRRLRFVLCRLPIGTKRISTRWFKALAILRNMAREWPS